MKAYFKNKNDEVLIWITALFGFLFCSVFIFGQISHLEIQNQIAQTLQIHSYSKWEFVNALLITTNRLTTISFGLALIVIGLLVILIGNKFGNNIYLNQAVGPRSFNLPHINTSIEEPSSTTSNKLISYVELNTNTTFKTDLVANNFIKYAAQKNYDWALVIGIDSVTNEINYLKGYCIKDSTLTILRTALIGKAFKEEDVTIVFHPHLDFKLIDFNPLTLIDDSSRIKYIVASCGFSN